MAAISPPELYGYLDYRAYLRDYCSYMKRVQRGFSEHGLCRRAGLEPRRFEQVLRGERGLAAQLAQRFADALGLTGDRAEYFMQLVRLAEARSRSARSRALEHVQSFRVARRTTKIGTAHAAYHATWYIPVVRELAGRNDFRADPAWIARRVSPPIGTQQAKAALDALFELGLLERGKNGRVVQSAPLLTTGPELHARHIAKYHRVMMRMAAESIARVPSAERDLSAVSLLVGAGGVDRIKAIVQRFRRELLELAVTERNPTQVIQTNIQIFPLSVPPEREPK